MPRENPTCPDCKLERPSALDGIVILGLVDTFRQSCQHLTSHNGKLVCGKDRDGLVRQCVDQ